jgi:hypothetical protein
MCRDEYESGKSVARDFCGFQKKSNELRGCFAPISSAPRKGVRYLGCYSLGFQKEYMGCGIKLELYAAAACDNDGKAKVPSFVPEGGKPGAPSGAGAGRASDGDGS